MKESVWQGKDAQSKISIAPKKWPKKLAQKIGPKNWSQKNWPNKNWPNKNWPKKLAPKNWPQKIGPKNWLPKSAPLN
jgi:hypothetical protein